MEVSMKTFQVNGRPCRVREPCYIVPDTIRLHDNGDGTGTVDCRLLFPSDDPAVKDRAPIVNAATSQFGAWNLANIAVSYLGRGRMIIRKGSFEAHGVIRSDMEVEAHLTGRTTEDEKGRARGSANIVLSHAGRELFRVNVEEFVELKHSVEHE